MDLSGFLAEWNSPEPALSVHTSGSTGVPKEIRVEKSRMRASARMTCDALGLKPGDRALLCLPLDFIAGRMMVVRSLERELELTSVPASNHPFAGMPADTRPFDLVALVPSQAFCSLGEPEEKRMLASCRNIIIGGGALTPELEAALAELPGAVWSTYGMTETLSHVALRRVNGPDRSQWYSPLPGVEVYVNTDGCLVIDAPAPCAQTLTTNDIAQMSPDGQGFRILGRRDNVICSGGMKLQIEDMENRLSGLMPCPFCITRQNDPKFGQVAVLLAQGDESMSERIRRAIETLDKYQRPRQIRFVSKIPLTANGKIDRQACESVE